MKKAICALFTGIFSYKYSSKNQSDCAYLFCACAMQAR